VSATPVFNTPVESALRSLVLLVETYPHALDLQRMVYMDYLLVHSNDAGGPASLHPPTPRRAGELVIRRDLIERGIYLLLARGLLERVFTDTGIGYHASDLAGSVVASLETPYSARLRERARWVAQEFANRAPEELDAYFTANLDRWGGEFTFSYAGLEDDSQ
jgi:hypothetical protein